MWIIPLIFGIMLSMGVWIGIALGTVGLIMLYLVGGASSLQLGTLAVWNILDNYAFAALPMYIFLAGIFVTSGLARRGYDSISPLLERVPGKLLVSNVVVDTLFGAVVGSSMATAATVGGIAYPELSKRGYDRVVLVGNLAGAGTLGSFVPPSLGMIIYGAWAGVSVGGCFAALLIPALITSSLFIIYLMVLGLMRPSIAPAAEHRVPFWTAVRGTKGMWPVIILMAAIMGTIYFGVATTVEAAGLATVLAIIMSVIFRTFSFKKLWEALALTVKTCGMLFLVIAGAQIFSIALSSIGAPRLVILQIQALNLPPLGVIALVYLLYIVLGCFFEFISCMLVTLPFLFPLLMSMGFNPFWLGAVCTICGEMGLLTPPVGLNLYVLQGITHGDVSLGEVARGSIPYVLLLGVTLILITIFPQLATWLPASIW